MTLRGTQNPIKLWAKLKMRDDHRPLWVRKIQETCSQLYTRHFLLPQFSAFGKGVEIIGPHRLEVYGDQISIGDYVHIHTCKGHMSRLCTWPNATGVSGRIDIRNYCLISPSVQIISADKIELGENVMLASHVYVSDADWHDIYHRTESPGKTAPIKLGNNVWVGQGAKILKGVTIGDNTVVAAGAIVTKSFPDNIIIGGNPARKIGTLNKKNKMTKRDAMFTGPKDYEKVMEYLKRIKNGQNSVWRWLKGILWPDKSL